MKASSDQYEPVVINNSEYAEISECGHEKVCKTFVQFFSSNAFHKNLIPYSKDMQM